MTAGPTSPGPTPSEYQPARPGSAGARSSPLPATVSSDSGPDTPSAGIASATGRTALGTGAGGGAGTAPAPSGTGSAALGSRGPAGGTSKASAPTPPLAAPPTARCA